MKYSRLSLPRQSLIHPNRRDFKRRVHSLAQHIHNINAIPRRTRVLVLIPTVVVAVPGSGGMAADVGRRRVGAAGSA
jgi:hypothetical protein